MKNYIVIVDCYRDGTSKWEEAQRNFSIKSFDSFSPDHFFSQIKRELKYACSSGFVDQVESIIVFGGSPWDFSMVAQKTQLLQSIIEIEFYFFLCQKSIRVFFFFVLKFFSEIWLFSTH